MWKQRGVNHYINGASRASQNGGSRGDRQGYSGKNVKDYIPHKPGFSNSTGQTGAAAMATIEDVAREAQVSVATVSRVLNNAGVVKKETAERVRDAIRRLSYTPNMAARNLRRNESRIIMMLAPNFTNPYYSHILSGICDISRQLSYITLIYNTYDTLTLKEQVLTELIDANKVDGTIILACNYDASWLNNYRDEYPIVQCSEYIMDSAIPHISVNNYEAAYESVQYLLGLGHRRIGFVGSENKFYSTHQRFEGYKQALADAGLPVRERDIERGSVDYSFQSGRAAAERLLAGRDRPTAVFCVSDVLALGVIAQAREMGIEVPRQLSVTGFDDVDYTTMFHPYLTTVRAPCYELGQKAMALLHQCMQKKTDIETDVFLPHQFVIRESCAPPETVI